MAKDVDKALARISSGLDFRETFGLEKTWTSLEAKFYSVSSSEGCGPNIIQARADAVISALSIPEMYCLVTGKTKPSSAHAPMIEALVNQTLAALDVDEAMEDALTCACLFGKGLLKIGFDSEYGYDEKLQLGGLGGTLSQYGKNGELLESGKASRGMPWVRPVLPHDVVVPWGTVALADAPEIWHRVVRHVDDVRADPKYSNVRGLEPTLSMKDVVMGLSHVRERAEDQPPHEGDDSGTSPEYLELWEQMDKRTRRIRVLLMTGEGKGRWIRDDENVLQIGNVLPWVDVGLTPRTRAFWATPLTYFIAPHQLELDDLHWQAKEQRRASILKLLVKRGALNDHNKAILLSAQPAAMVEVEDGVDDIRDVVMELGANSNINTLLHLEEEHILRSARETIGMSRAMSGEYDSKNRRPAAETYAVEQGGGLRLGRRQKGLRRSYTRLTHIIMSIIAKHWTQERAVRYIGDDGRQVWGAVTREILEQGKWAFQVTFSPEHYETPMSRQREALQLMATFAGNPLVDQAGLVETLVTAYNMPQLRAARPGATDANLRVQMQQVQGGGGGASAGGGQGAG